MEEINQNTIHGLKELIDKGDANLKTYRGCVEDIDRIANSLSSLVRRLEEVGGSSAPLYYFPSPSSKPTEEYQQWDL